MRAFVMEREGGEPHHGRGRLHPGADRLAARLGETRSSEGADLPPLDELGRREKSVLVAEEDVDLLSVLEFGLTAQGLDPVWTATDGEGALEALVTHHPDFLLLGYELPKVSGEAVAVAARRLLPHTVIVVYSNDLSKRPPWADAFLFKPNVEGVLNYFRENA